MQSITKKEFFRLLINGESVKAGYLVYPGEADISDKLIKQISEDNANTHYRKVTHVQSNAIMFEDKSWLWFDKPKNCDSRKAYRHEINGNVYISLVDHRPAYHNQFGTQISEQTMILAYKIA